MGPCRKSFCDLPALAVPAVPAVQAKSTGVWMLIGFLIASALQKLNFQGTRDLSCWCFLGTFVSCWGLVKFSVPATNSCSHTLLRACVNLADWAVGWRTEKSKASLGPQFKDSSNSFLVSVSLAYLKLCFLWRLFLWLVNLFFPLESNGYAYFFWTVRTTSSIYTYNYID